MTGEGSLIRVFFAGKDVFSDSCKLNICKLYVFLIEFDLSSSSFILFSF